MKERRVDIPRSRSEPLVFPAKLGQKRLVLGADDETLLRELRRSPSLGWGELVDVRPTI
jgi:predicted membrane-bound spermidine synthase